MLRRVLAISAAAHVLAIACIMHMRATPMAVPPAPVPADDVTLDLDEVVAIAPVEPVTDAPRAAVIERSAPARELVPAPAATHEFEAPPDTAPYASNGTIIVFAPNIGLGAPNAANPFLGRNALPPVATGSAPASSVDAFYVPENKRAEQSVKDALRAHDQSVGLGVEGPVLHALEDATHAGFAPDHGTATFMAVIDEHGLVIDLKVLGTHDRGWDDVRARAVKSLATAKIDLRGVKRAELKIEVTSDIKMASGSDPKKKVVPTGKPQATPIITAAPGSPSGADTVQTYEVAQFDETDLAGKPQKVVHAKLVVLVTR